MKYRCSPSYPKSKTSFRQCTRYERDTLQIVGESGIVQSAPAPLLGVRHAEKDSQIDVQETVIKRLNDTAKYCTGTSNCYFAMKYGMKMMGTHPHEWFMFHGAQFGYKHANYMALENWVNVYDGDLGIALSDTYTSEYS